jgi:hypothetical protein
MVVNLLNSSITQQSVPISDDFMMLQEMFCWKDPLDWTRFPNISLSLAHSDSSYFVLELPPQVCSHAYSEQNCEDTYVDRGV